MNVSAHEQPDPRGSFSPENAPQIVVRAGKTFLCAACGTLVEVPPEVVGQLVLVANPSSPGDQPHPEPKPSAESQPQPREAGQATRATGPSVITTQADKRQDASPERVRSSRHASATMRPPRPKRPKRESFVGQRIDGLRVPSALELDRAFAWVSFHLRVLDRQGAEIKRLKQQIDAQKSADERPATRGAEDPCVPTGIASASIPANERGPPS